jgi:hypothetical protein
LYWRKKYFKSSGNSRDLRCDLQVSTEDLKKRDLDSLINLHLARCYLKGEKVNEKNEYLSWYFYKKTKEIDGKKELKQLEETTFKRFIECYKMVVILLCIGKFSRHPKKVFMLIGKEIFWTIKKN